MNEVRPGSLLAADEPPPVEVVNRDGRSTIVLVCDHASNRVPRRLSRLGITAAELDMHIGWDPGAAAVARRMSQRLDAALVLSGYSRLVIDCNRPLGSPGSIPAVSAGITVPGNERLNAAEAAARADALFWPYHRAIAALLDARAAARRPTALLAIHSFTPDYPGHERPWHVAVSYNRDRRLAALLLPVLQGAAGLVVGDNLPYAVSDTDDYTIPVYGERRGLPHALIEIRQDGIADEPGVAAWADRLVAACAEIEPQLNALF
jgi:predicted N-formylglutamate amidohydrolase